MTKSQNVVVWVLCAIAALAFLASGAMKLSGNPQVVEHFSGWGLSDSFRVFIGVCEILGAVSLLIPPFTTLGGTGLAVTMVGAIFIHLSHQQAEQAPIPLVLFGIVFYVSYVRRDAIGKLFGQGAAAHV